MHDCRHLNRLLRKRLFKLERLQDFVKLLTRGDLLIAIDFSSAYWHVPVATRFRTLLGFRLDGVDYVFCVLPFGLSSSAYAFSRFAGVTARALRLSGLTDCLISYMDDLGIDIGQIRDPERVAAIVEFVRRFGWHLNMDKLDLRMVTALNLLGFNIDTGDLTVGVPDKRRAKLSRTVRAVLAAPHAAVVRDVCRVIGQIQSMHLALGITCRIRSRYLNLFVKLALLAGRTYDGTMAVTDRALAELHLWERDAATAGRRPMHEYLRAPDYVLHCDASDSALAGIVVQAPEGAARGSRFWRRLSARESAWSSCLREMTGYRHSLAALVRERGERLRGTVVEIVGDHRAAVFIFANGGSSQVDEATGALLITDCLLDMLELARGGGFEARFRWVRRQFVQDADNLSKWEDRMDFSLRPILLARVRAVLGPWDIDRFAAPHNTTAGRFNARFGSEAAEAADALGQCWRAGTSFVLPDFFVIDAIMDRIERDDARAILIVPEWTHRPWWHRLWSRAWEQRRRTVLRLPRDAVVPNNRHCFFLGAAGSGVLDVGLWAVLLVPTGLGR